MTRRKMSEKNIRKITRVGKTSLSVTLPAEMAKELGWRERQKVVISKKGKILTIKDWKK